jgi:hypothetical protein
MLKKAVSAQWQKEFSINQRIIKRSFCQHFLCRNSKILNQYEIIRWAVMKSLDKSKEEIIKSFSEKQNDCFLGKEKKIHDQ